MSFRLPDPTGPLSVSFTDILRKTGSDCTLLRIYYPAMQHKSKGSSGPLCVDCKVYEQLKKYLKELPLLVSAVPENLPLSSYPETRKLPILLFSHGLLLPHGLYSFICSDLASHGYLVAAVAHTDASVPMTFYMVETEDSDELEKKWYKHQFVPRQPLGTKHEAANRQCQTEYRVQELIDAMDSLKMLNEGRLPNVLYPDFDLTQFQGRLQMEKVAAIGHCMGGVTALVCLSKDDRIKVAIALDPWMVALNEKYTRGKIKKPMMIINCTTRGDKRADVSMIEKLGGDAAGTTRAPDTVTLLETNHYTQTDLCFLPEHLKNMDIEVPDDFNAALSNRVNKQLILSYLCKYLNIPGYAETLSDVLNQESEFVKAGAGDASYVTEEELFQSVGLM